MRTLAAASLVLLISTAMLAQSPAGTPPAATTSEAGSLLQNQVFKGDLTEMKKRRGIRVGVAYNRTHYFIDRGVQRGMAYEMLKLWEDELNKGNKSLTDKVNIVFVPMSRDEMAPALLEGRVDLIAANVTITPERRKLADFSDPVRSDVSEIVVSGPGAEPIATKADLGGKTVLVRKDSNYHDNLRSLNTRLKAQGLPEVIIQVTPMTLEDDDVLEMVNAGIAKYTVVDNFLAEFWQQIFTGLKLHPNIALTLNGEIGVAMRPNSPELKAAVNDFLKRNGRGSMMGNMLTKRYLSNTKLAKNSTSEAEMKKFQQMATFFQKYAGEYKLDYLLMAAQGFQESGLDQSVKSPVGAIGVMQVMPATGKELAVGDIGKVETNIHAGVKYMRFMMDQYYKDEQMDDLNKALMTFAGYNAGPNRIRTLRAETAKRGLNPNLWFNNVERVVSERIGRETVTYVSNIYKYYVAYTLAREQLEERRKAKAPTGN
jgi:membrane-bound lytic murein transglycosylase MltF